MSESEQVRAHLQTLTREQKVELAIRLRQRRIEQATRKESAPAR